MNPRRFALVPMAKPRMTGSDKWNLRPPVVRYRAYCDRLRYLAGMWKVPSNNITIVFRIPMPRAWRKRERASRKGQPHQQKPDIDNLLKAFLDALCESDAYVYDVRAMKCWDDEGSIEVYEHDREAECKA